MPGYITKTEQDLGFMTDRFGIDPSELEGLDVNALIDGFDFRGQEYTAEEVRAILKRYGSMYRDDGGRSQIFSIFNQEGRALEEGDHIECIGWFENAGTLVTRTVFDLADRLVYMNDEEPFELDSEQLAELSGLAERFDIRSWSRHTAGVEEETTGNYAWKLAFYLSGGEFAVYDGSSGDMSHMPKTYGDVKDVLNEILRAR